MGVINITPNSFSDGGKNFNQDSILSNVNKMIALGASVIDFGAESTAPFNKAISESEELARFEKFLYPVLPKILESNIAISIDTYKPSVFLALAQRIYSMDEKAMLIWNDVSGIVDQETNDILSTMPNATYVLSHNLSPRREETSSHMSYVQKELSIDGMVEFFKKRVEKLDTKNIILDPCFGFSKSIEQNWKLIKDLALLVCEFDYPWLLGVSRKSFFKDSAAKIPTNNSLKIIENLHLQTLLYWSSSLPKGEYSIRLHDLELGKSLDKFLLQLKE